MWILSIYHSSRTVSPWSPHSDGHEPVERVFEFGRFDREHWRKNWHSLFDDYDLIHNNRKTNKIEVSSEGDGAFTVFDVDTLGVIRLLETISLERTCLQDLYKDAKRRLKDYLPNRTFALSSSVSSRKNNSSIGYHLSKPQVIYHCIKAWHGYCNLTRRVSIGG